MAEQRNRDRQARPQRRLAPGSRTATPCVAWACASSTARATLEDTPAVRGMINKVDYLVKVL
jgi:hypothetical protein